MSLTEENITDIWNYLGDNEVFFPKEEGNVFTNSIENMKNCFSIMEVYRGYMSLQLKKNVKFEDCMGHLEEFPVEGSNQVALVLLYSDGKSSYDEDEDFFEFELTDIVDIDTYRHYVDTKCIPTKSVINISQ